MELVILGLLALYGILCTTALVAALARGRPDRSTPPPLVPEKIEVPETDWPPLEGENPNDILPILAEHFPEHYERYRRGDPPERWIWETCRAIRDARPEIEELCS